jgi:hypothetical protein
MQLWTWQEPGFSLTSGCVDWTKSPTWNDPELPGARLAYPSLAERLGTDQLVWFRSGRADKLWCGYDAEWLADVPIDRILCGIDTESWNMLIKMPPAEWARASANPVDVAIVDPNRGDAKSSFNIRWTLLGSLIVCRYRTLTDHAQTASHRRCGAQMRRCQSISAGRAVSGS